MTTEAENELTQEQVWAEELAKRESTTDDTSAAPSAPQAADTQTATNANDGVVTDDNQEPAAPGAQADDTSASTATGQEPKNEPDQLAQIMEQIQKLSDSQRNLAGHIGGLKAAQTAMQTAMEKARSQTTDGNAPSKGQVADAAKNPEEWESLKKDFPEWAEATEKLLSTRLQTLQAPQGGVDVAELDRMVTERAEQLIGPLKQQLIDSHLNGIVPKWKEAVKTEAFGKWFEQQPADVKDLAKSPELEDAARMLRLYADSSKPSPSAPETQQLQQTRQQKLAQAAALPKVGSTPAAKTVDSMTEQEFWDHEARRREKSRAQRGY